jgi:NTP pyrophosphatase (non-canonical NTP hydrolase)
MSRSLADLTGLVAQVCDIYAERCDIARDDDWYALKLQEEAGEVIAAYLKRTGRGRVGESTPEQRRLALEDEIADLMAQVLLFARHNDVDIEAALARKWFTYLPKDS